MMGHLTFDCFLFIITTNNYYSLKEITVKKDRSEARAIHPSSPIALDCDSQGSSIQISKIQAHKRTYFSPLCSFHYLL